MAIRKKLNHDDRTRAKIQTSQIINRLEKHIFSYPVFDEETNSWINKELMTTSQVTAALGLIKKTLPDLASIEYKGEIVHRNASELTEDELYRIAATGSTGDTSQESSQKKLN